MKVIVFGTRGIPDILGGVETHAENLYPLIKELAGENTEITLVRRSCYVHDQLTEYKGVKLVTLYAPRIKSIEAIVHSFLSAVYAILHRPDIVHVHAIGPGLLIPLTRLAGLKVIMTHHGPDYKREKWGRLAKFFLRLGEWCSAKFSNALIVVSKEIERHMREKFNRESIYVPNGVSSPDLRSTTNFLDMLGVIPGRYVFTLGRFVEEKGFDYLIRAFKKAQLPEGMKLVIAGDADHTTEYSEALKKKAVHEGVVLAGFVKGERLAELFSHTALFVLPSFYEGLPISLLEAMSFSCVILASDIEANNEVGLPQDCYFEAGNEGALIARMETILHGDIKRVSYSMEPYDWKEIARKTYDVYRAVAQ